jgi:type IV secretory pathway TrbD component
MYIFASSCLCPSVSFSTRLHYQAASSITLWILIFVLLVMFSKISPHYAIYFTFLWLVSYIAFAPTSAALSTNPTPTSTKIEVA